MKTRCGSLRWAGGLVGSGPQLIRGYTPSCAKRCSHSRNCLEQLSWGLESSRKILFEQYFQQSNDRLRNVSQLIYLQCGMLMLVDQPRSGPPEGDLANQQP